MCPYMHIWTPQFGPSCFEDMWLHCMVSADFLMVQLEEVLVFKWCQRLEFLCEGHFLRKLMCSKLWESVGQFEYFITPLNCQQKLAELRGPWDLRQEKGNLALVLRLWRGGAASMFWITKKQLWKMENEFDLPHRVKVVWRSLRRMIPFLFLFSAS